MIATNVRRLAFYLLLSFVLVSAGLAYWQVVDAQALASRSDNPQVIAARRSAPRGSIFDARGKLLASTDVVNGVARRSYTDSAFSHVIGYASLRFGTTALERAWDDLLAGRADPNPLRDIVSDILDRPPAPKDLTLTIDQRLQDFAAQQLGDRVGAVVALDPESGAILAMTSTPTFDASALTGDSAASARQMERITSAKDDPLVDRTRQGRYPPGSTMKVFTAAAALDAGAITPRTTFKAQPRQETEGFVVDGFRITEHDLSPVQPALWQLSEALQVSSNIYFAHVGLELGADAFLDYAHRFGFCAGRRIGPPDHGLTVDASYVTDAQDGDCGQFSDRVEVASAAFGQAQVIATPVQMALIAATIANDGTMPEPYVVADARTHLDDAAAGPSDEVLQRYAAADGRQVISPQAAEQVRTAMVDAVEGQLGRLYAGQGDVSLYGVGDVQTAGKTGTAQRGAGQAPHSWFIGFAPAEPGGTPEIAVAVIVEGGGSGAGLAAPIGGQVMAEWLRLEAK